MIEHKISLIVVMSVIFQLYSSADLLELCPVSSMPINKLSTVNILDERSFNCSQSAGMVHWLAYFIQNFENLIVCAVEVVRFKWCIMKYLL